MTDVTVIATAAISGAVGVSAALIASRATLHAADAETRRQQWEHGQKRRSERQETYQVALDLMTDLGWRWEDEDFDVVHEFNIPFLHAANRVRVYGSPASIAAIDEIQDGLSSQNRARTEAEFEAASAAISSGHNHLVMAARDDVGPRKEDGLADVPFRQGAGPAA